MFRSGCQAIIAPAAGPASQNLSYSACDPLALPVPHGIMTHEVGYAGLDAAQPGVNSLSSDD